MPTALKYAVPGMAGLLGLGAPEESEAMPMARLVDTAGGLLDANSKRIATRVPGGKDPVGNSLTENLIIDAPTMELSPKQFDINVKSLKNESTLKSNARRPDVMGTDFRNQLSDNLLFMFDQVPGEIRDQSKLWYDGANRLAGKFAQRYGVSQEQTSAVMAALSPQMDWFKNVSLAERVMDAVQVQAKNGVTPQMREDITRIYGDPKYAKDVQAVLAKPWESLTGEQKAIFVRTYDEAHNPRHYRIVSPDGQFMDFAKKQDGDPMAAGWGSNREIAKAISVLEDGSIENISKQMGGAHKVRNFFNNINVPNDMYGDVTIDTHAVAADLMSPFSGASPAVKQNLSGNAAKNTGAIGTYGLHADAYRQAAGQADVLPREMQSITWEAIRGLFKPGFKSNPKNVEAVANIWQQYRKGEITLDKARQNVIDLAGGIENPSWYQPGRNVQQIKSTAESSFQPSIKSLLDLEQ